MTIKPLFSLKFTILLSIALFFPFILRTLSSTLEPYPSILLPSGAGKINLKKEVIKVNNLSIYGYDFQGKLQKVDAVKFLAPIPSQYLYSIARNEFGLSTKTTEEIWIGGFGKSIKLDRKLKPINPENQKLAKLWLSDRLSQLGLSTSSILIRYELRKLAINSGKEVSKEIINEKNILLQ